MAKGKGIGFREYCDSVYCELTEMKARVLSLVSDVEQMEGPEKEQLRPHITHFQDIAKMIEWKLEILTKVCPFDWTGFEGDVESTVSVRLSEPAEKEVVAGGFIGG